MVNIENITKQEEDKKLHIKRTRDLLNKFFDNIFIFDTSTTISISENESSRAFLYIHYPQNDMLLEISELEIPKYTDKVIAFAREYEKKFNVEVTLKTDYSR